MVNLVSAKKTIRDYLFLDIVSPLNTISLDIELVVCFSPYKASQRIRKIIVEACVCVMREFHHESNCSIKSCSELFAS